MGSDPQYAKYPELSLAQHIFHLTNPSSSEDTRQTSLQLLQDGIREHKMAPLYRFLAHPVDGVLNSTGEGGVQSTQASKPAKPNVALNIMASRQGTQGVDLPWDEQLYQELAAENEKELEGFAKEEEEAAEKAGDTEVQAARGKRAEFWARVGDKVIFWCKA